jgi:release factor glutamine methyltransferase
MRFFQGDLFDAVSRTAASFDFVVANPPYIRSAELETLAPEIRQWEPVAALDGGTDGLDYYQRIIGGAPNWLAEGGTILLEIGSDLAGAVTGLFAGAGRYQPAAICRDCAGRERVVMAAKGRAHG